ncbi:uncharacterized protein [Elaeis guineensis]|uniref:uncharacterized protein n=1 Tax=Elaeis guineensis var. tenera TaxID=51953 RepID=UPI003C6DB724
MESAVVASLLLFLFVGWSHVAEAQLPIPAKIDGFVYKRAPVWGHSVVVEAFFDPMCPDSRDSWPPLKKALKHYSSRLSVVVHPFPLPYHSNAFIACRALHIANKLNTSSTFPLLELFFKHQEEYYNTPTYNMSRASIIHHISKLAVRAIGKDSLSAVQSGFNDSQTDAAARISFKYGCSRGVTGTPYFFVNGMPLSNSGSALDYKGWKGIIDPLLGKQ